MDAMLFFKYGIYKCKITNPHNVSTRLFHYSDAREIGLCITMIIGRKRQRAALRWWEREGDEAVLQKKIMHCLWVDWPRRTTPRWIWTRKSAWICSTGRLLTWAVRGQPARLFARGTICTDYARLGPFLTSFARRQMYLIGCIPCAHGWGGDEQANGGAAVGRWCRKKKRRVEGGEGVHVRWWTRSGGVRMRCAACTLTGWQWSSKWKSGDGTGEWKSWSVAQKNKLFTIKKRKG